MTRDKGRRVIDQIRDEPMEKIRGRLKRFFTGERGPEYVNHYGRLSVYNNELEYLQQHGRIGEIP